jgi:hypothetical protein
MGLAGLLVIAAGVAFAVYRHNHSAEAQAAAPAPVVRAEPARPPVQKQSATAEAPAGQVLYVRRTNSVVRDAARASATTLKKYHRGDAVTLIAADGAWTKVRDGDIAGWMRASVLSDAPPPP